MSDDTPTQRYPVGGEPVPPAGATPPASEADAAAAGTPAPDPAADAPTETLVPPPPPPGAVDQTTGDEPPKKRSKALMITLICIGSALLLALIILLIVLLTSEGTTEPTPSPAPSSPSPTPSATPTPTPTKTEEPPAAAAPSIATYSVDKTQVDCAGGGTVGVTFSWATTGVTLWFGVGTDDAKAEPFGTFPPTHTIDFDYQCGQPDLQQRYTITVEARRRQDQPDHRHPRDEVIG